MPNYEDNNDNIINFNSYSGEKTQNKSAKNSSAKSTKNTKSSKGAKGAKNSSDGYGGTKGGLGSSGVRGGKSGSASGRKSGNKNGGKSGAGSSNGSSGGSGGKKGGKGGKNGGFKIKNSYTALLLILLCVIAIGYYLYNGGYIFKKQPQVAVSGLSEIFNGVAESSSGELKVHFIDVGQGDCTLIQFPDGKNMLVDCGERGTDVRWNTADEKKTNYEVINEYLTAAGVNGKITVLLATHADSDHIGNMADLFADYEISYCLRPSVYYSGGKEEFSPEFNPQPTVKKHDDKGSNVYSYFLKALSNEGCGWEFFNYASDFSQEFTFEGQTYSYSVNFLTPLEEVGSIGYSNANDYSPIVWLKYGEFDFVFSGDANKLVEKQYLEYVSDNAIIGPKNIELYKAAHHGSDTSSCAEFLNYLNPDYTVFSCGKGNSYSHPHQSAMDNVTSVGSLVYRTDLQGNVSFTISASGKITSYKTQNELEVTYSELIKCPPRKSK